MARSISKLQVGLDLDLSCGCRSKPQPGLDLDLSCGCGSFRWTVKGTLTLHLVCNFGVRGIIEVCQSSCFCEVCFLSAQGECKNRKLVEDFAWVSLYKNLYIAENIENKLWDTYSLPYTHAKKLIF